MKRTHNMIGRNNSDSLQRKFNNAGFGKGLYQLKGKLIENEEFPDREKERTRVPKT